MQFALQALPFSRHAQNDTIFAPRPPALRTFDAVQQASTGSASPLHVRLAEVDTSRPAGAAVRILRSEGTAQGARVLISGRMADVCAALNRLAVHEVACG